MDAGGAAESERRSAFSSAPVGEEVDFRLPVDWKNLLNTACLAGAGSPVAALPEPSFLCDIVGRGVTAGGQGRAESASPQPQLPGVYRGEYVATQPCAGAGGGTGAESRLHQWDRGGGCPQFRAKFGWDFWCRERAQGFLLPPTWFVR